MAARVRVTVPCGIAFSPRRDHRSLSSALVLVADVGLTF
jgi:hypothetical protein